MARTVSVFCLCVALIVCHVSGQTRRNVLLIYGEYLVIRAQIDCKRMIRDESSIQRDDHRILVRLREATLDTELLGFGHLITRRGISERTRVHELGSAWDSRGIISGSCCGIDFE